MKKQFDSKKQLDYWLSRKAQTRLVESEKLGNSATKTITNIYEQALRNVNDEVNKIYMKYSKETGMAVDDLSLIINGSDRKQFLLSIQRNMQSLGFDISEVYKPGYLYRLSRLDAIKEQIYWELATISKKEEFVSKTTYAEIIKRSYSAVQTDFVALGVNSSFTQINTDVVEVMLNTKWFKKNFSQRIWKNVTDFSTEIPQILGGALVSGTPSDQTTRLIRDRFKVAINKASRLVRTETNYFHNQAELKALEDDDIKRYQFDAVMDGKTSQICSDHNGNIYETAKASVGENYPPLHPNCRSTTLPILEGEGKYIRKRPINQ